MAPVWDVFCVYINHETIEQIKYRDEVNKLMSMEGNRQDKFNNSVCVCVFCHSKYDTSIVPIEPLSNLSQAHIYLSNRYRVSLSNTNTHNFQYPHTLSRFLTHTHAHTHTHTHTHTHSCFPPHTHSHNRYSASRGTRHKTQTELNIKVTKEKS